jgi:hypothetical protein
MHKFKSFLKEKKRFRFSFAMTVNYKLRHFIVLLVETSKKCLK